MCQCWNQDGGEYKMKCGIVTNRQMKESIGDEGKQKRQFGKDCLE